MRKYDAQHRTLPHKHTQIVALQSTTIGKITVIRAECAKITAHSMRTIRHYEGILL